MSTFSIAASHRAPISAPAVTAGIRKLLTLETRPIVIEDGFWVGAMARVGPLVTIETGAVLTMGSTATPSLDAGWVYSGNSALALRLRNNTNWYERDV